MQRLENSDPRTFETDYDYVTVTLKDETDRWKLLWHVWMENNVEWQNKLETVAMRPPETRGIFFLVIPHNHTCT